VFQQIVHMMVAQLLLSIMLAQLPVHKVLAVLEHCPDAGVHNKVDVDPAKSLLLHQLQMTASRC
jgi:hypothetical protein